MLDAHRGQEGASSVSFSSTTWASILFRDMRCTVGVSCWRGHRESCAPHKLSACARRSPCRALGYGLVSPQVLAVVSSLHHAQGIPWPLFDGCDGREDITSESHNVLHAVFVEGDCDVSYEHHLAYLYFV